MPQNKSLLYNYNGLRTQIWCKNGIYFNQLKKMNAKEFQSSAHFSSINNIQICSSFQENLFFLIMFNLGNWSHKFVDTLAGCPCAPSEPAGNYFLGFCSMDTTLFGCISFTRLFYQKFLKNVEGLFCMPNHLNLS